MSSQIRETVIIILLAATAGLIVIGFYITRQKVENGEKGLPVFDLFFPAAKDKELLEDKSIKQKTETDEGEKKLEERDEEKLSALNLRQLTTEAVAGFSLIGDKIRFVEKATGHVFEIDQTSAKPVRISNTTVPKIQEAYFSKSGGAAVFRYAKDKTNAIENVIVKIGTTTEVTGRLPISLTSVTPNPQKDAFFYLEEGEGGSIGTTLDLAKKQKPLQKKTVFNSPAIEWVVSWPTPEKILLATKPSAAATGFAYLLNSKSGELERVLGDRIGLTASLSPDGQRILFGETSGNSLNLGVFDRKSGEDFSLAAQSLPEKCVWSAKNKDFVYCAVPRTVTTLSYPDAWYRGEISFSDDLWKFNLDTGEDEIIITSDDDLDATRLMLSPNEKYLYFQNKRDDTLWILTFPEGNPRGK